MTPGRRAWCGRLGGVDDVVVERVLRAVEQVPPGRVVSYGDVAALVGIGPRQVGSIMKAYGGNVTWWRVTDAAGDLPATLMDVAPTALHLLGLAVPRDCDGRVLLEMLEAKGPGSRAPRYRGAGARI